MVSFANRSGGGLCPLSVVPLNCMYPALKYGYYVYILCLFSQVNDYKCEIIHTVLLQLLALLLRGVRDMKERFGNYEDNVSIFTFVLLLFYNFQECLHSEWSDVC